MQILVIGTGWLGSAIARRLSASHSVLATFRKNAVCLENVVAFRFLPGEPLPPSDIVVLCFPPDRHQNTYAEECLVVAATQRDTTHFVLCSSTSVIADPTENEAFSSTSSLIADAENRLAALVGERLTIVRFGGLIGPDRLPVRTMLEKGSKVAGNQWVNVIHRDDAADVVGHVIEHHLWGKIFAAVAPEHPSKYEFYSKMSRSNRLEAPDFIASEKMNFSIAPQNLLNSGYRFQYPSPMEFPELQT